MKRTLLAIISVLTVFAQTAFGLQNSDGFEDASVQLKFYDRTMYYPGNDKDNPINIEVSVMNKGTKTLRFKIADDKMFSIDFRAYTLKNTLLNQTPLLITKRSTNQTVYFREIALEPGEVWSFTENVKDYLTFEDPSIYYLELSFYPELYRAKHTEVLSNRLSLDVRPAPGAASSVYIPLASDKSTILKPESISPDKVIEQTIVARQKSLWDQYFLYMDLEEMMTRNADINRKYRNASADERKRMNEGYRADLMQNRIEFEIVAVPEKFYIENTSYSQTEGTVSVLEWFKYPNFSERKRYIYKLRQRDGIWQIYDYSVTNLGTE